jgi:hypothetical protein
MAFPLRMVRGIIFAVQVFVSGLLAYAHYSWCRSIFAVGVPRLVPQGLALGENLGRGFHQRPDLKTDLEGLEGVSYDGHELYSVLQVHFMTPQVRIYKGIWNDMGRKIGLQTWARDGNEDPDGQGGLCSNLRKIASALFKRWEYCTVRYCRKRSVGCSMIFRTFCARLRAHCTDGLRSFRRLHDLGRVDIFTFWMRSFFLG